MMIKEVDEKTVNDLFKPELSIFSMKAVREFDKSDMRACTVYYPDDRPATTVVQSLKSAVKRLGANITVRRKGSDIYMIKGGAR